MKRMIRKESDERIDERTDDTAMQPMQAIFGLRYLEEEEAEIYDVVGCASGRTCGDDYIVA